MIATQNISLSYSGKPLFKNVNIKFTAGNCYGIIGANGTGKSTFLKVLSGELEPTTGEVVITPGERMAVLRQNHFEFDSYEVLQTVIMGHKRLYEIMKEKDELYAKEDFTDADGERIPLYLSGGDRLTVNSVGSVVRNYTVAGSEESELLRRFYQPFVAGLQRLDSIASTPGGQPLTQEQRQTMAREYTREYRRIKREQFRFIIENKSSLAAVYALYQRLPGDRYLFNLQSDAIYYRTVADALAARYPESPYLTTLTSEIARLDARLNLSSSIAETGYPDLELPDMYGRKVRLSSLRGKVILVDFWSAESGNSNALNADLKVLYDRFRDRGFEVYQVSADTSKPDWIASVQEQGLPWVSVCDFRGEASPAMGLYNVRQLPTNFLIDRSGVVVDRDLYGDRLEKRLAELL